MWYWGQHAKVCSAMKNGDLKAAIEAATALGDLGISGKNYEEVAGSKDLLQAFKTAFTGFAGKMPSYDAEAISKGSALLDTAISALQPPPPPPPPMPSAPSGGPASGPAGSPVMSPNADASFTTSTPETASTPPPQSGSGLMLVGMAVGVGLLVMVLLLRKKKGRANSAVGASGDRLAALEAEIRALRGTGGSRRRKR